MWQGKRGQDREFTFPARLICFAGLTCERLSWTGFLTETRRSECFDHHCGFSVSDAHCGMHPIIENRVFGETYLIIGSGTGADLDLRS